MTLTSAKEVIRNDIYRRKSRIESIRSDMTCTRQGFPGDSLAADVDQMSERIVEIRREVDLLEEFVLILDRVDSL